MAVLYSAALKTARMQAVVTDAGTTAVLEIGTSGMGTVLATIPLNNPIGTVSNGVLTLSVPVFDSSADATGTAASARIRKASGGADVVTGLTVGSSGTDIVIDNTSIATGQRVEITSMTLTHG